MSTVRRAILSVSDKRGLTEFAQSLAERGVEIFSTGGTARELEAGGVKVTPVSAHTGAPEILGGRVKTLHPKIHGGILARDTDEHRQDLAANEIDFIDLVVVNLYPFRETIAREGVSFAEAIENIDIGGPCMVRAAAKNHERVIVVVDPDDYGDIAAALAESGTVDADARRRLALKAFAHTASYDAAITNYLATGQGEERFGEVMGQQWRRQLVLRYGENPHQEAAFYAIPEVGQPSLAGVDVLQGKALSYNNILDLDAAFACCREFDDPTAVVVKHTNPCGVASAGTVAEAYETARATDPTSSFGGIVAVNREVDEALAAQLVETFLECIIAPGYSSTARELLARKKNLRLISAPSFARASDQRLAMRTVAGGILVQEDDTTICAAADAKIVTERKPSAAELASLDFAWRVAKHVKSNAIVFCRDRHTTAVGAGQMSRIDSVELCKLKAQTDLANSCVASDAFFPFRDGLDALADAGATAVIQPGGSIRDQEVIDAANERGVAMLFTGMRHFRH
jgi:phosphoribosylaminoimidazolecarboxamide formyltransferase/IMP cyclohydrolase